MDVDTFTLESSANFRKLGTFNGCNNVIKLSTVPKILFDKNQSFYIRLK